ncbi:MAG: hypothetical protein IJM81_03970 [Prevotella sp.]|nr:hypothetical protein [Prevotella sp.]
MKQFAIIVLLACNLAANAQQKNFNPAKFEADLEQFVATEAGLTPQESARFFPLYREMRKKQIAIMSAGWKNKHLDMSNDKICAEAIRQHDNIDVEVKELQRTYHNKFLKVLPAGKVLRVIRAEDKFHRQAFRRADRRDH